ncbi:MAG: hypothetical protein EOP50_01585 [Sphingobacteriales bacterium]|nr:MAG: hypothetical protein EOP50_01585 [Sphingobacteriales bacterium]
MFLSEDPSPAIAARLKTRVAGCVAVRGGSINRAFRVELVNGQRLFLKLNSAPNFPQLLSLEAAGLKLIAEQQLIRTPQVIDLWDDGALQFLVLEWIDEGPRDAAFWAHFGRSLALLHQQQGPVFGAVPDNYMGAVPQSNRNGNSWSAFFVTERIEPMLRRCRDAGLVDAALLQRFAAIRAPLEQLFPEAAPCLVHGDLWSGNFLCAAGGEPVLIDPAAYWGERSVDLAMTNLFGGFSPTFYAAYHEAYPLPPQHRDQWALMNLYPLLIHLYLFGPHYRAAIEDSLRKFG